MQRLTLVKSRYLLLSCRDEPPVNSETTLPLCNLEDERDTDTCMSITIHVKGCGADHFGRASQNVVVYRRNRGWFMPRCCRCYRSVFDECCIFVLWLMSYQTSSTCKAFEFSRIHSFSRRPTPATSS
ncbi:hypothetical protein PROFUN_06158 [Planoprotostelium fungivorum]|uniref:Uncharacterized protein n=1 Tax=Planoprotostelium fungivorum TaxID=1890364 RepID=A0A2P6NPK0_9EUKA|nr:hypothetical protein PROFUN_06158 [Planoprotostelium fungivorum]